MKYTVVIAWSKEDGGFIASVPELPGCSAFGETEEETLREANTAVALWIRAAKTEGRRIPDQPPF
jgi:predicted RNase H-like HicB family nuclease